MEDNIIRMGHGSGGRLTRELIRTVFIQRFGNSILNQLGDAAVIPGFEKIALTTDSFVIDPIFFPGGDIGKLAVCGTVNDLCVAGAVPKYLSAGFILEEGFSIDQLIRIADSMAMEAKKACIEIVTGDTKVVKRGQCDKIYINTSGIGLVPHDRLHLSDGSMIEPGDKIIITGSLGDHAIAILSARENLSLEEEIISDACPLNHLTEKILKIPSDIRFMRDITRGGIATILTETCEMKNFGIEIEERTLPIRKSVRAVCELYGFDPIYLANEGKLLIVVKGTVADKILNTLQVEEPGKEAAIIGEITQAHPGLAIMKSVVGGSRIIDILSGEMLPRIC
jgi:hydrogenase expression/formation protein HypE